jgi:tRNA-splicing ligase RtcB
MARELVDEAPGAYKDIGRVMRAQQDLTRIVRRLRPVLCFKGS